MGGFRKCFEKHVRTHEKTLRTTDSTLFGFWRNMQNETTRHKGKHEERQAGRQGGGQAGTRRWYTRRDKTSGRWARHPTQAHMWGDDGRQWVARGDKTCGRRTHHFRQAHMRGDNAKQFETMEDKTFASQGRALFQHLNLQKLLRTRGVFSVLTLKRASHHNFVQLLILSSPQMAPHPPL